MLQRFEVILAAGMCAMAPALSAGIVIRHDVPDSRYLRDASDYPAVFPLDTWSFNMALGECAATLIDPQHAVTAAHCIPEGGRSIPVRIAGKTYTVGSASQWRNPCFSVKKDGPDGADVAVLRLNKPVPASDATPIPVYRWNDEQGKRIEIVGWGDTGKAGIKGKNTHTDRKFRVAENIVTSTSTKGMVEYKLDQSGLPLEGIAWSGDSGGPAFIIRDGVRYIAGVNSAGSCCKYGSVDGYSRLSTKAAWIAATISGKSPAAFSCQTLADAPTSSSPPPPPPPAGDDDDDDDEYDDDDDDEYDDDEGDDYNYDDDDNSAEFIQAGVVWITCTFVAAAVVI